MFRKVVTIERLGPPQVVLPVKRLTLVFNDETRRAARLRTEIEDGIRSGDPRMEIVTGAPYTLTVNVREFLEGNTRSIEGNFRLSDGAERTIYEGNLGASNAGALTSSSDEKLVADAAGDVVRIVAPRRHRSAALLPKGRMSSLSELAERGDWGGYIASLQRLPRLPDKMESYREYALAVAYEARAYTSANVKSTVLQLRDAVARNVAAARMNPSEKFFSDDYMPLHRAFETPGLPPKRWVDPRTMELWESMLVIEQWMSAPAATGGALNNRNILDQLAAGHSDETILADIARAERVAFDLNQMDMTALSKAGVTWKVIDGMRKKAGLPRREFYLTPERW